MKTKTLSNITNLTCYGIAILVMKSIGYTILTWQTWLFLVLLFVMNSSGAIWMSGDVIEKIENLSEEDLDEL